MGAADAEWWTDPEFWEEMYEFIFPPEHLALGEEVAAQVEALAALPPGASVIDLGCGPGRVAVPLARRGHRVTGVDAQERYLERARAHAARDGVPLALRRGDIARLADEAAFDAALCLFTSFGYFADPADDRRVLAGAHRALRPGGRLVLETAHRDGVVRLHGVREAVRGARRFREEPRFDPVTGILETRWSVSAPQGARAFTSRMRTYTATALARMLREAGFAEVRLLGGLEGGAPSIDRYTVVALALRGAAPADAAGPSAG